ncbi:MAG TPA: DUF58 domain-containing protein [Chitinophagaceae bacterium]|nr:DUF58 domain-containing protein [Chitinophagaceae bacterium]
MVSYIWPVLYVLGTALLLLTLLTVAVDAVLLYSKRRPFGAQREVADRLSNGDANRVRLLLHNSYGFRVQAEVIDELPVQFQERSWVRHAVLEPDGDQLIEYTLTPVERGTYTFGAINVYVQGPLKLLRRRFVFGDTQSVRVYPSFIQMRRYQLMATASLQESGVKRMRRLGHSLEFEQIKEYVRGDDYRTINWKATARRGDLMVNNFTDERSQQIYCIINKGRTMKMPFEGMTLLDYAINAALVLSNTALLRQDKAGLICLGQRLDAFLTADKKTTQLNNILETLYRQETDFLEPDLEQLFAVIRNRITHRSLLVYFTNYESIESLERDLPSLKRMAHYHLLLIVFFENTELKSLVETKASTTEEMYIQTIGKKYMHEKKLVARELQKAGILTVLTTPEKLTVNTLNKYLEIKNRQSI